MPTGYTAGLVNGDETPEEFMLKSLRSMGVAIMQRDDPLESPVQRRIVEDYYINSVVEAQAKFDEALSRTDAVWNQDYLNAVKKSAEAKSKSQFEYDIESDRIHKAIDLINSKTFDADLQGWKKFMMEQLEISMPHEPGTWYDIEELDIWKQEMIHSAKRSLEFAVASLTRQQEIVKSNNAWIDKVEIVLNEKIK